MQAVSPPSLPPALRTRPRTAVVASADGNFRQRLSEVLIGLRWHVREAEGGAQAWAEAEAAQPEAIIVDSWLPDLDLAEFLRDFRTTFPDVDLLTAGGSESQESPRGPYRQELLYALHRSQDTDTAIWNTAPGLNNPSSPSGRRLTEPWPGTVPEAVLADPKKRNQEAVQGPAPIVVPPAPAQFQLENPLADRHAPMASERLPEIVGNAPCMIEVSRRVRLVAPRSTPVLIEGPTGSGKELVAEHCTGYQQEAVSPLLPSIAPPFQKRFLRPSCLAIRAERSRVRCKGTPGASRPRNGGTLFLDEIGEMPLALQAKLLRFFESGELQRVGDNETVEVDVALWPPHTNRSPTHAVRRDSAPTYITVWRSFSSALPP